jgi:hypothetical protein|tara:strand:+ start:226 stop:411 length:186 start_codon:yes stop_codon:yes gene_type:complete
MVRNLWDQERRTLFKNLVKEYEREGYGKEEAGRFARQEVNEMMLEKEEFVNNIWDQAYDQE